MYFFYWAPSIITDELKPKENITGERKKWSATPPFYQPFSSSHSLPLNHPAPKQSCSYVCVSALFVPLSPPSSLLLSLSLHPWGLTHSLQSLHLMHYWRLQRADGNREEKKKEEGRKQTELREIKVEIEQQFAVFLLQIRQRLIMKFFVLKRPTFVHWYRHAKLIPSFHHNACY